MSNLDMENAPASTTPIILAEGLSKRYTIGANSLEVLRKVDLTVQHGEFLALRGASGAGKSTLLHLLGGLDLPNSGTISLLGKNLRKLSNSALTQLRNDRVGFVFQAYHLLPELNALENVMLPARMARKSFAETQTRANELLTQVGLAKRIQHRPYELSGGEQQRVAIARALINNPDVVLADEPTGNLDSHTGEEIFQLLCSLGKERGVTLIVATHSARLAAHAQRVVELVDGEIVKVP